MSWRVGKLVLVIQIHYWVVNQIFPYPRGVDNDRDMVLVQLSRRSNSGEHENLQLQVQRRDDHEKDTRTWGDWTAPALEDRRCQLEGAL